MDFEELVDYMTSVFHVLFVTSPDIESVLGQGVSAAELAGATAAQAFDEAGLASRAKLDKASFTTFVQRGLGFA